MQALVFLAALLLAGLAGSAAAQRSGTGARRRFAVACGAVSAGEAGDVVAAAHDGLHVRLRRAARLCRGAGRLDAAGAVLYGAAILWDLGFDTIYAHQDREDDALVGVKSTARLFGERTAPFLAACYAATVLLLVVAGWVVGLGVWFYPALAVPAALLVGR